MMFESIEEKFKSIQDYICQQIENVDTKANFNEDLWQREDGGGGRTRIIEKGLIIENNNR